MMLPVYTVGNFDFYLCLRINFHTLLFWVLILAAGVGVLIGSLSQRLGVLISFGGSGFFLAYIAFRLGTKIDLKGWGRES